MKKIIILFAFAFLPFLASANFDADVHYGMTGSAVLEVQEFLGAHGFFGGPYSGNFYSLTLDGVKRFQASHGIPATGYFGPLSRAAATATLGAESSPDEVTVPDVPAPATVVTPERTYTRTRTGGSTGTQTSPTQGTITAMPLSCSLDIGSEGTATIKNADGSSVTIPSGSFLMTWSFDDGAVGVLESDNDDGGTLNANHGERTIRTKGSAHYKLTVSKDGEADAVCEATATHSV